MKRLFLLLTWLTMMLSTPGAFAAPPPAAIGYLVTNDDYGLGASDTATFFTIAANGTLSNPTLVNLGGEGTGGCLLYTSLRSAVLLVPCAPSPARTVR